MLKGNTMIQIKDVLHYYIGQNCHIVYHDGLEGENVITYALLGQFALTGKFSYHPKTVKPLLRRLSDMTEDEMICLYDCEYLYGNHATKSEVYKAGFKPGNGNIIEIHYRGPEGGTGYRSGCQYVQLNRLSERQFHYLLKQGFDLWGLIESGQAIDQKTLNLEV